MPEHILTAGAVLPTPAPPTMTRHYHLRVRERGPPAEACPATLPGVARALVGYPEAVMKAY